VNIYRQKILDHYRNPRNSGTIKNVEYQAGLENLLCGDQIKVYVELADSKIKNIKFTARGCAISIAAMSMLSEQVLGMRKDKVLKLKKEDILQILGIDLSAVRQKCAMLGLRTLKKCLKKRADPE